MQRWILEDLRMNRESQGISELLDSYMLEHEEGLPPWRPDRIRSARNSMTRALRKLKAAGEIEQNCGNWQPVGEWPARKAIEERRRETAYHEAGHAVIGLAGQRPVAFVTIRPRGNIGGYVAEMRGPTEVGYIIKDYKVIANLKVDAFGNPVPERKTSEAEYHADTRMSIGGPMAEAHWKGDHTQWRQYASPSDMQNARHSRRQLGDRAKSWDEYAGETYALICNHWDKIEAVAGRLLEDEAISGADVDDLCRRVVRRNLRRSHDASQRCRKTTLKAA
jgi:hypothetical protein